MRFLFVGRFDVFVYFWRHRMTSNLESFPSKLIDRPQVLCCVGETASSSIRKPQLFGHIARKFIQLDYLPWRICCGTSFSRCCYFLRLASFGFRFNEDEIDFFSTNAGQINPWQSASVRWEWC